ncbi:MAG: transporter family protein [Anaerocolumna sp.]|jgi:putative ABC transport system ATP-binding protein|nr:transporter family protein [Anaerocolumna sp.]
MSKSNIRANNLVYTIKEGQTVRNILNGISCEIQQGILTAISGPSGSGKTTFMYALAGLIESLQGEVLYGDKSIYDLRNVQRDNFRLNNINFIYQHLNLFGFMNVEDNIKLNYMLRNEKVSQELEARIDKYLEIMNLGNIRKKEIQTLSGGEKQRVAIIRAFVSGANYIFADEPTGNLDKKNSLLFMECLKGIMKESQSTVVLVTHDKKILDYGEQQLIIEDGKLV